MNHLLTVPNLGNNIGRLLTVFMGRMEVVRNRYENEQNYRQL